VSNLNPVASISSVSSFSGVTSGVGVASSPLEVNIVSNSSVQIRWDKIVFSSGISLNDVSSFSSDIQVENSGR